MYRPLACFVFFFVTQARDKAPGQGFNVNLQDDRFAAVLEGDSRFGIDRTAPDFKVSSNHSMSRC